MTSISAPHPEEVKLSAAYKGSNFLNRVTGSVEEAGHPAWIMVGETLHFLPQLDLN